MAWLYKGSFTAGLASGGDSGIGPVPSAGTAVGSTIKRVHPYTRCNFVKQRNHYGANTRADYISGFYSGTSLPLGTGQANHLSGSCQFSEAGAFLANAMCQHGLLQFNTEMQQTCNPQAFNTNAVQNLITLASKTGTSQPISSSALGKDRSHPFYSRKRVEPMEGMTRTRDKYRVVYTEKQRHGLEKAYTTNKFITTERRAQISEELDLSARQIKIWFQNRRAKERRDSRKSEDSKQTDSENSIKYENNADELSPKHLADAVLSTSCRFTGNNAQSTERLYSSEQCRFMNRSHSTGINTNTPNPLDDRYITESRDYRVQRPPVSPSEWSTPAEHFIPSLDVSPLGDNYNFAFGLRL